MGATNCCARQGPPAYNFIETGGELPKAGDGTPVMNVEQRKAIAEAQLPCWLATTKLLLQLIGAAGYLYVGLFQKPVAECGTITASNFSTLQKHTWEDESIAKTWNMWYIVQGSSSLTGALLLLCLLVEARILMQNDNLLKYQMLEEQGKKEEAVKFMEQQDGSSLVKLAACAACSSCLLLLLLLFHFGWLIFGIVHFFRTRSTCTRMAFFFMVLGGYQFFVLVVQICLDRIAKRKVDKLKEPLDAKE
jgi:TRAP-type C4-dicarboxylate transport system permease small subunit